MYFIGSDTIKEKWCCDGTIFVVYVKPMFATSVPTKRQIFEYHLNWSGNAPLGPAVPDIGLLGSEFGRRESGLMGPQVVNVSENEALCFFSSCRLENYLKESFLRLTILRGWREKVRGEWNKERGLTLPIGMTGSSIVHTKSWFTNLI